MTNDIAVTLSFNWVYSKNAVGAINVLDPKNVIIFIKFNVKASFYYYI